MQPPDPEPLRLEGELTALDAALTILRLSQGATEAMLDRVVTRLPALWPEPKPSALRIVLGRRRAASPGDPDGPPTLVETFETARGTSGRLEALWIGRTALEVTEPERRLLRVLTDLLGAHFDHRESDRALAREVALAEERQRRAIASDLHDHLGQALAFLRLQLSDLRGDVVFSGLESRLEPVQALLDKAIRYTRTLTAEISPPVLYELGFLPAVEWLVDRMRAKHDLPVKLDAGGELRVEDEASRVVLFLAIRELLINAAKHAEARRVCLRLEGRPDAIRVAVEDDGSGFDPSAPLATDGFGLFSLTERVRSLGGTVDIRSAPRRGTTIELSVPRSELPA